MSLFLVIGGVCILASFLPSVNKRKFRAIRVLGGLFLGVGAVFLVSGLLPPTAGLLIELVYALTALLFVLWFWKRELLWLKEEDPASFNQRREGDQVLLWVGGFVIVASLLGGYVFELEWLRLFWIAGFLMWGLHLFRNITVRNLDRGK